LGHQFFLSLPAFTYSRRNLEKKILVEQQLALRNHLRKEKDNNDFDILIFTQHWPYTVCSEWMEQNKANECSLPKEKNSWTIHGECEISDA
jgi:hypothetical protein